MIDYRELKTRRDEIAANIKNRNMKVDVDEVIALQDKRAVLMHDAELLRASRNENAMKMKGKMESDARQKLIDEGRSIKERIAAVESSTLESHLCSISSLWTMSSLARNWT